MNKNVKDIDNFEKEFNLNQNTINKILEKKDIDINEFESLLKSNPYLYDLINRASDKEYFQSLYTKSNEAYKHRSEKQFINRIKRKKASKMRLIYVISTTVAAAVLFISFHLFNIEQNNNAQLISDNAEIIRPTLIFENSINKHHIALPEKEMNIVNNISIPETSENTINIDNNNDSVKINTYSVVIPKGFTYSITLSDRTEVLLNADSELRYPESFGDEREVELVNGEAYFNVSHSESAFKVKVGKAYVKVYGTEFNINAYEKDIIKTTLVRGSVGTGIDGFDEVIMKSNQMAVLNVKNNIVEIKDVDALNAIGWKRGYFNCEDTSFEDFIGQVSRWYNINFEYNKSDLDDIVLNMSISRDTKSDKLLNIIESAVKLTFIKKGANEYEIINKY